MEITGNFSSESTIDLMRLLNSCYLQDLNHILVFIYPVKSGVGSRYMQAINVFMAFSVNQFFVTLAREWIVCKCFAFFDHYSLSFRWQCADELQSFLPND